MAKASDVIRNYLMLPLSVPCIFPTNIRVSDEMPDVVLKLESRTACLKCRLKIRALCVPTFGILWRVERQRDESLQLSGDKLGC